MFKKKLLPLLLFSVVTLGIVSCSDDTEEVQTTEVDYTKGEYKQKVLVEDITSASCVWCPLGSFTIEELEKSEYKDQFIGVGVHGDFNTQLVKDPFVLSGMTKLMTAVGLKGWPHLSWNRNTTITGTAFQTFIPKKNNGTEVNYTFDANLFKNFYTKYKLVGDGSPIGIKIESNLTATSGKVDVSLKFGQNINQELKYVVYLLEDGLVFQQANASSLYGNNTGSPRWEMDFVHDHVVRATNNFLGETIAAGQTMSSNEFKATANLTYSTVDLAKANVVVAVLDKDGNVLNVQKAKANVTQDYEKK
ncbi:Omp28-related outer membrane protein [Myroides sp. JBRI-B21084]|uniref:Omp28-related outer membrane protein n=1 Tax=Myroides sp. JBRI-B21084 TaxID=3119977 RepID=UPI0026E2EB26|nr:Omp28-related outer membrane protein [Paenimyroides cloacae]WKW46205.1 Omp28-related outer membrane protein [Paenimyroides cloacae]